MTSQTKQWIIDSLMTGEVIVDIGQVDKATARVLNKMVAGGEALKWRGKWYPVAGASYGLGPDKTCWGLASKFSVAA